MASINSEEMSRPPLSRVASLVERRSPQEDHLSETLPDTADCPAYGLVMCCWNNILGPHAKRVWRAEGEPAFRPDLAAFLSTHTLTSCERPRTTIDTKLLLLPQRGVVVSVFVFSGWDGPEKTVFALSLVVPFAERHWYLPLHDMCVARLRGMIRRLRVLQEKNKNVDTDYPMEAFSAEVPYFVRVLTLLKTHSLPASMKLGNTVFAPGQDRQLDNHFTKIAIASHLQTCGCSIVIGNTTADINLMISTLALFLAPSERKCCLYLDDVPRIYQKDVLIQGFIKDSVNLDDYLRLIMTSQYPTSLIDMVSLEVRQMQHFNDHAYRRHEETSKELQSLWLNSDEPIIYSPVVHFSQKPETETIIQDFWKEMFMLPPQSDTREAFVENFLRVIDRKAIALIKYVEEETNRGTRAHRLSVKRLKSTLRLLPEGNFRIVLAAAEKLQPGLYTLVCGNPALPRDAYGDLVN